MIIFFQKKTSLIYYKITKILQSKIWFNFHGEIIKGKNNLKNGHLLKKGIIKYEIYGIEKIKESKNIILIVVIQQKYIEHH